MSLPRNATCTPSPYFAEMSAWAEENIPETAGFYILHFENAIGNKPGTMGSANHYCGYAANLRKRFMQHLGGCGDGGARLCEVANERNIKFWMVAAYQTKTVQEAYDYEQYFKMSGSKNPRKCCPECGGKKLPCPRKRK